MDDAGFDPDFDYQGFGRRIAEAMAPERPTAFSERIGVQQSTFSKYLHARGSSGPRLDLVAKIADGLGCSIDWLVWGRGEGPQAEREFVKVPRYDAALAAGAGSWNEGRRRLDEIPFTSAFLRKKLHRTSTKGLCVLEARGDSMEPTIGNGAMLLIDEDDRRIDDGVFAFVLGDAARVKRFETRMDAVKLISDNSRYEPEFIIGEDQANIQMIGKVLWVGQFL